jgi:hypothetical protein
MIGVVALIVLLNKTLASKYLDSQGIATKPRAVESE